MSVNDLLGSRIALWWIGVYTRTLPESLRVDRRDELAADLHDQLAADSIAGVAPGRSSREVAVRALGGVPQDLMWRVEVEWERDRLASFLSHPSTILTFLFALLLPINVLWDALLDTGPALAPVVNGLAVVVWWLAAILVAYALAVVLWRVTTRGGDRDEHRLSDLGFVGRVVRFTVPGMFFFFALSGLWRFSPDPLGQISAVAWALFGVMLLVNIVALGVSLVAKRKHLHLRKVPS